MYPVSQVRFCKACHLLFVSNKSEGYVIADGKCNWHKYVINPNNTRVIQAKHSTTTIQPQPFNHNHSIKVTLRLMSEHHLSPNVRETKNLA
jgi:hypothetical protein